MFHSCGAAFMDGRVQILRGSVHPHIILVADSVVFGIPASTRPSSIRSLSWSPLLISALPDASTSGPVVSAPGVFDDVGASPKGDWRGGTVERTVFIHFGSFARILASCAIAVFRCMRSVHPHVLLLSRSVVVEIVASDWPSSGHRIRYPRWSVCCHVQVPQICCQSRQVWLTTLVFLQKAIGLVVLSCEQSSSSSWVSSPAREYPAPRDHARHCFCRSQNCSSVSTPASPVFPKDAAAHPTEPFVRNQSFHASSRE